MVTRGGMTGNRCNLFYLDIADIVRFLDATATRRIHTSYEKRFPPGSIAMGKLG
jgi:hypothetical protein